MDSLNRVLSRALLEEKKLALQKLQGYSLALEQNNRQFESQVVNNIKLELKKVKSWEMK